MAAAVSAAECGVSVGLVDDNPCLGGQRWRSGNADTSSPAAEWARKLDSLRVDIISEARVFQSPEPQKLLAERQNELCELSYKKLILATGARERFLPFPGWTLPNVMGAGGLQALVKSGLPIADKRVVVAGSGRLLLACAAYLKKCGAAVLLMAEQAPFYKLIGFGLQVLRSTSKTKQ